MLETLYPVSDNSPIEWDEVYPSGAHWEAVADPGDSKYIRTEAGNIEPDDDWFNMENHHEIPGGATINSITFYVRFYLEGNQCTFRLMMKGIGAEYEILYSTSALDGVRAWIDRSQEVAQNPDTSSAWTLSDINNLILGARSWSSIGAEWYRCSEIYMKVNHSVPPIVVTPSTLALALTFYAPTIEITEDVIVTPPTLALSLTAYAPTVLIPMLVTPTTLALLLTTYAPSINIGISVTPSTLALILTTYAPVVGTTGFVTPATLALVLTTFVAIITVMSYTYGGKSIITDAKLDKMLKTSVNIGRWRW